MNLKYLISIIALSIALNVNAQIGQTQIDQIDSLFIDWNKPNHPGGSIGIMQNGQIVFSKAYGLASMEYLVPNTTATIFNIASVSKQFTAMGIVLLQEQGKLSYDDDIRKYLPELPDFGHTITIRHMLHHTSGLRSLHGMLRLAGWRSDDSRTNEDLNRFMKNQQDLNFIPGDQYLYCNTGYMLMVNIIEKVTGEKFPKWMKETIFEPLGMMDSYVEDNYSAIVANNATSYYQGETDKFERAIEYWGYVGSGNMHSTTNDLLKWLKNFYNPQENWEASFKAMQTFDELNDGSANNYAFGVIIDEHLGHNIIQHSGGIGGFRSFVSVYPANKLSIAVLTNFSSSSSGLKANQIAEILLPKVELSNNKTAKKNTALKQIKLSNEQLIKYESHYWNDKNNYARKIYVRNDTLRYFRSTSSESPIVPVGKDEFQMLGVSVDLKVKFEMNGDSRSMIVTVDDRPPSNFYAYQSVIPNHEERMSYTGKFYSPELETSYDIYLKNDTLFAHHPRLGDFKMSIVKKDVLESEWPLSMSKYKRDQNDEIIGISVSNGRVIDLWFEKQK